jgi:hypothetical protein
VDPIGRRLVSHCDIFANEITMSLNFAKYLAFSGLVAPVAGFHTRGFVGETALCRSPPCGRPRSNVVTSPLAGRAQGALLQKSLRVPLIAVERSVCFDRHRCRLANDAGHVADQAASALSLRGPLSRAWRTCDTTRSTSALLTRKCGVKRSELVPPWITPTPRSRMYSSMECAP